MKGALGLHQHEPKLLPARRKSFSQTNRYQPECRVMSASGTWRLSSRCIRFRRDRRYADIDRPLASIASEAYDPSATPAANFAVMQNTTGIERCGRV
jgi:hypothetical protein